MAEDDNDVGGTRLIREYKPHCLSLHDRAFHLAMSPVNEDDIRTFLERLADAYAFLRECQRKVN